MGVFKEMFTELSSDLNRAKGDAHSSDDQFHRRIYLRTLMSYSEAMLFQLKQYLLDQREHLNIDITDNERLILNEQTVEMDEDGSVQRRNLTASHERNMKFTLKFISKRLLLAESVDFHCSGWEDYRRTIQKRNDLTHPKFPKDIQITEDELKYIDAAELWLGQEYARILNGWAAKSKQSSTDASI